MIDDQGIKELQKIIQEDYGIEVTQEECRMAAENVVKYLSTLFELSIKQQYGNGKTNRNIS